MAVKKQVLETEGIFFITTTCHRWLSLFDKTDGYDIVYNWFDHLKTKGHFIVGYVIMPNHLHALLAFTRSKASINQMIGNGKRFMAYELVERLQERNETQLLKRLSAHVSQREKKRGKLHEVFQPSFDWKECYTHKFIIQKLNYIHKNPCSGKWKLAEDNEHYLHSSAGFYYTGKQGIYPVTHYGELEEVDLTRGSADSFTPKSSSALPSPL